MERDLLKFINFLFSLFLFPCYFVAFSFKVTIAYGGVRRDGVFSGGCLLKRPLFTD